MVDYEAGKNELETAMDIFRKRSKQVVCLCTKNYNGLYTL